MAEAEVVIPSKEELLTGEPESQEFNPESAQADPVELEARQGGWVSKEEWTESGKDPRGWRQADVWLDRGEFFKKINTLQGELSQTKQQVAAAFETGRKMAEQSFKKEITDLKAERRQAMVDQDFETVDKLDEKLDDLKEKAKNPAPVAPAKPQVPPEFDLFVSRNPWYNQDSALHYAADGIGYEFAKVNPNAKPADLYFYVETQMRKRFGEQAGGEKSPKVPPAPDGGQPSRQATTNNRSLSEVKKSLSEQERSIMKTLIQTKVFKNEEEYLKEYANAPGR